MSENFLQKELSKLKNKNLRRELKTFGHTDGRFAQLDGREYLIFCSNDYLGLSQNPNVISAIRRGLDEYGAGAGAARLVSGSLAPHALLEERLKEFMDAESALLFNSGYSANSGIIPALAGKGDAILADRLIHASMVDGCMLSRAEFRRYPHGDMKALEKLLVDCRSARNIWIVTDGMFSMDGDLAPLDKICELAETYDAKIYLDDAHAFGILGPNGRGTAELFGVEKKIDVHIATLGKAGGVCGAFVSGKTELIDYLVNKARSFIYSTALPPAVALGAAEAVNILSGFAEERKFFLAGVEEFHVSLEALGFAVPSQSYIVPIITGSAENALTAERKFREESVYVQAIRPPTVPEGTARLRLTLTRRQQPEDRSKVLAILGEIRNGRDGEI